MNALAHKVAELLLQGLKPKEVKSATGVTDGFLKRLHQEPAFQELLKAKSAAQELPEAAPIPHEQLVTSKYEALEAVALDNLLANAAMASTTELLAIIDRVQKKKAPASGGNGQTTNVTYINGTLVQGGTPEGEKVERVIRLSVPSEALGRDAIQLSASNQVMSVGNTSLMSMDADETTNLIEAHRQKRAGFHSNAPAGVTAEEADYYDL